MDFGKIIALIQAVRSKDWITVLEIGVEVVAAVAKILRGRTVVPGDGFGAEAVSVDVQGMTLDALADAVESECNRVSALPAGFGGDILANPLIRAAVLAIVGKVVEWAINQMKA